MREGNYNLSVHVVSIFFFPFICTFTFGFWTVKKNEQSKEKDIHILHLIASGIFMCSQSVTFIVDIHLPLIAWLHIGGHSHKTAEWNQNQKSFCHLLYYAQIDWFLRRVLISVLNCVHVQSGYQHTLIYGNARNNHWHTISNNQHCVIFISLCFPPQHKRIALYHYTLLCICICVLALERQK